MERHLLTGAVALALFGGVAHAGGSYGPATCYIRERDGSHTHMQACHAGAAGSMIYTEGLIRLRDGMTYSSEWEAGSGMGDINHQHPKLRNVVGGFVDKDVGDFCAPISGGRAICAHDMRNSQEPWPAD